MIDKSISQVLNSTNFQRNRAYQEFGLKTIQVKAAMSRSRAIEKWKQSYNLIKDLIGSSNEFKSKKDTWTKGTNKWLKRFKLESSQDIALKKKVLENYESRIFKKTNQILQKLLKNMA